MISKMLKIIGAIVFAGSLIGGIMCYYSTASLYNLDVILTCVIIIGGTIVAAVLCGLGELIKKVDHTNQINADIQGKLYDIGETLESILVRYKTSIIAERMEKENKE